MVMYHNCGGERMATYIGSVGRTLYGDVPHQELLDFHYRVLDYKQEKSLAEIPKAGFSANYVREEAKRARSFERHEDAALAGERYRYPDRPDQRPLHSRRH
jgi:hypothetical protein